MVLGLATSHRRKLKLKQVRHGDQPWYPHVLWALRWTIAHSTWMAPPCLELNAIRKTEKQRLEVLHLFRCFTHTHRVSLFSPWVHHIHSDMFSPWNAGFGADARLHKLSKARWHQASFGYMMLYGLLWHNRQQGAVPDQAGTSKCWCSSHSFHLVQAIMPGVFLVLRSTKSVPRRSFPSTLAEMSLLQLVMACWRHRIGFVSCNPSIHRGGWFQCLAVPFLVELND